MVSHRYPTRSSSPGSFDGFAVVMLLRLGIAAVTSVAAVFVSALNRVFGAMAAKLPWSFKITIRGLHVSDVWKMTDSRRRLPAGAK